MTSKIPKTLEYILWEVPWTKRLYKVERSSDDTAKMVYTGGDSLPGRISSPFLPWANDSVFDHMI